MTFLSIHQEGKICLNIKILTEKNKKYHMVFEDIISETCWQLDPENVLDR